MVVEIYAAETLRDRKNNIIHTKDQLLETLYCGDNVSVTSKEYPLGNYYWREKVPPTGYTLDPTPHPFSIEYSNQNITVNLLNHRPGTEKRRTLLSDTAILYAGRNRPRRRA